jgi:hypothetical protein
MKIKLIETPGAVLLQAEGLAEAKFDRFVPFSEPGSDRTRFDDQLKASARSMSVTVRKAVDRMVTGTSAWSLETDSDTALELGMNVAEALALELEL